MGADGYRGGAIMLISETRYSIISMVPDTHFLGIWNGIDHDMVEFVGQRPLAM